MRCTPERNAYHTVSSLTLVLASGTVIDTAAPDAEATFAKAEPELAAGLTQLREELLADDALAQRVRHKYAIRNTNGYALSALLDGDTPLEIFRRLRSRLPARTPGDGRRPGPGCCDAGR
jgi:D-lactate dehydrogenase